MMDVDREESAVYGMGFGCGAPSLFNLVNDQSPVGLGVLVSVPRSAVLQDGDHDPP